MKSSNFYLGCAAPVDVCGQRSDARVLEEAHQPKIRVELTAKPIVRLYQEQRMCAEIKEGLIDSYAIRMQKLLKYPGDG
jgi:hypothetical protein